MRFYFIFFTLILVHSFDAMCQISGKAINKKTREAIAGASVTIKNKQMTTITDYQGMFNFDVEIQNDTLIINYIGYEPFVLPVISNKPSFIEAEMEVSTEYLEEIVVNTGYQSIPKERATGSFTHIDQALLERSAGYGIVQRLEGITNGLYFDMASSSGEPSTRTNLRVRGVSTINGETQPLIVVDGFPYEGDMNNINPNDVESITVLKDAAAASIWGARAGNGVIVVTMKKPKVGQSTSIDFSSNLGVGQKPDLFYDPKFIPSSDLIDLEILQFERGIYRKNDQTELSPVIDILFARAEGKIDENDAMARINTFRQRDIRKEADKYLYRSSLSQQYALNIRGGGKRNAYSISAGMDKNFGVLKRQNERRFTFAINNNLFLAEGLELQSSMNYVSNRAENNGLGIKAIAPDMWSNVYTYAGLKDEHGLALPITKAVRLGYAMDAENIGLLDWTYRPLDELDRMDNTSSHREIRLNNALKYRVVNGLTIEGRYQYQILNTQGREFFHKDSFFTRNIVNRYTQNDLSRPIPHGGILDNSASNFVSHSARLQSFFDKSWLNVHDLNLLVGAELREDRNSIEGSKRLYGYDDNLMTIRTDLDFTKAYLLRPTSSAVIPYPVISGNIIVDRFMSYYGNAGYSYSKKYLLSASVRWDGSNIFGVDFNQKGVPLWSVGLGWNLDRESFFKVTWVDLLKLRGTYGANGNIVRSQSALPYIMYGYNSIAAPWLSPARLGSVGNPSLSWEKVNTLNLGLDFSLLNRRILGSFEWYKKNSENLIGADYPDPTTGIIPVGTRFNIDNTRNYADMTTDGVDVQLTSINTLGRVRWSSTFLFSFVQNQITNYYTSPSSPITTYLTYGTPAPRIGASKDQIYAIPWYGLSVDGDPLVPIGGELGTDYTTYFNQLKYDDLLPIGVKVAPFFGSVRNSFDWRQLSLSFNILWRAGHKFRKESVSYNEVFASGIQVHKDYLERWKMAGDENKTHIPALPTGTNSRRDQAYLFSDVLIEDASSIRLKDIQLSYDLSSPWITSVGISSLRLHSYVQNLGIIWKGTKADMDPDARAIYPQPLQINIGIKAKL